MRRDEEMGIERTREWRAVKHKKRSSKKKKDERMRGEVRWEEWWGMRGNMR
jgi:hypothetical protein